MVHFICICSSSVNCDNYGCEDICVLEPEASEPTCLCREGKQLGADKKSCEGKY